MATPPIKDPMFIAQAAALAHSELISSEKNVETLMSKIAFTDDNDGSKSGLLLSIVELLFNTDKRALSALICADFDYSAIVTGLYCWDQVLIFGAVLRQDNVLKTMSDAHFKAGLTAYGICTIRKTTPPPKVSDERAPASAPSPAPTTAGRGISFESEPFAIRIGVKTLMVIPPKSEGQPLSIIDASYPGSTAPCQH